MQDRVATRVRGVWPSMTFHKSTTTILATSLLGLFASCKSVSLESLEIGMRPHEVRAIFGQPTQEVIADRREGGIVRKMLIEEYPNGAGSRLSLIYVIPADLDELEMQGDLAWARSVAPSLQDGSQIHLLDSKTRMQICLRTARLLRYRRFSDATEQK